MTPAIKPIEKIPRCCFRVRQKTEGGLPANNHVRLAACLIAHLLEVVLYAAVLALLVLFPAFGSIGGEFNGAIADFFHFSLTCYTTLGIGDIHPLGPLRLIVGVESLNGLLLITRSASLCYLNMQEDRHPNADGHA